MPLANTKFRQRKFFASALFLIIIVLIIGGCGGNSATPAATPLTLAFASTGALDGSNSPNLNATSNIWLAKSDGSGATPLTRLTASGAASRGPVWSPDGQKIAFTSLRALDGSDASNTAANLWIINADGTGLTALTRFTTSGILVDTPIWSPDGHKLAFVSSAAIDGSDTLNTNGAVNVWVINSTGTGAVPLTKLTVKLSNPLVWTSQQTVWSPDSTRVAFISAGALNGTDALNTNQVFNLWVANADGSARTPLTNLTASGVFQSYPSWAPNGIKLAFVAQRALDGSDAASPTSAMNLWMINADGSGAAPLTRLSSSVSMFYPVWSPDGTKIAFGSDQALDGTDASDPANNVWTINADGTGPFAVTRLTASGINFELPMFWSPDGKQIALSSLRAVDGTNAANPNDGTNVWVIQADGSSAISLTKLTSNSAESFDPSWKP